MDRHFEDAVAWASLVGFQLELSCFSGLRLQICNVASGGVVEQHNLKALNSFQCQYKAVKEEMEKGFSICL